MTRPDSTPKKDHKAATEDAAGEQRAPGGEIHQRDSKTPLTTNQGVVISDNQNSLRVGARGPTLLEDFIMREKITHFDHERIPERIVHARGSGAHGYFQVYESQAHRTRADFLADPAKKTPVFARFSTVAGGAGSGDLPRDVRGFAVKFYTDEGNFDLVGNNIPVFFIQDAIKFPDLIHSVKMEPDRGFPQAASAHDTFWDFVSLMPESIHMIMWAMSDRAIPRSLRMMEGFGIHTFRFVDAKGRATFVKFHWRPVIGSSSVLWDEAVAINGADPDFHRRDLWESIERGDYPEFEFGVQAFDQATADLLQFDILDPTKIIPEEIIPVEMIGKMVLDRNPDNFFAETEQVAFHPGHVVPGIDFSSDPLLQGRLHSYLDTQLSRLGSANFHELPVNRPRCPMHNFQRDGMMRMSVPKGRVAYEPNTLSSAGPRERPDQGFRSHPREEAGTAIRARSETFADHYSQARLFWRSMSEPEQRHIVAAYAFELGKVETVAIRQRILGHLRVVDPALENSVAGALGMKGQAIAVEPAVTPLDLEPSPSLSLIKKAPQTITGRTIGVLLTHGFDASLLDRIRAMAKEEGARVAIVAPIIGTITAGGGQEVSPDHALAGAPSVFFDAAMVIPSEREVEALAMNPDAVEWVQKAFRHQKVIGHIGAAKALLDRAGVKADEGVVRIDDSNGIVEFVQSAKKHRIWDRKPS